jgi:hypothetical protein
VTAQPGESKHHDGQHHRTYKPDSVRVSPGSFCWQRLSDDGHGCGQRFNFFYLTHEPVAFARNGFHKAGSIRGVAKAFPQARNGGVQAVIEVDERVRRPETQPELFSSYDLARLFQQHAQNAERLFLQAHTSAVFAQFASAHVYLKMGKSNNRGNQVWLRHSILEHWTEIRRS